MGTRIQSLMVATKNGTITMENSLVILKFSVEHMIQQ